MSVVFFAATTLVRAETNLPTDSATPENPPAQGMLVNSPEHTSPPAKLTHAFLAEHTEQYRAALQRSRTWLDTLVVDPFALREHGIKGKKKLTELLDTYRRLLSIAASNDKPDIIKRIRKIAETTSDVRFHDMPTVDATTFKEDATSYLRTAFLLDKMELLPPIYRQELTRAHPRLNEHMHTRGVNQQMAFHLYYKHFNLDEPFPLSTAFQAGVIAARRTAAWFERSRMAVYDLTHEVFVPYEFGEKPDTDFFSAEDKAYLKNILMGLSSFYIGMQDPDVVGELVSCMNYLEITDTKEYRVALEYLLQAQGDNGTWGNYNWLRGRYGDYVDQAFYLHTTMVVLDALITAFEPIAKRQPDEQPLASDVPAEPAPAANEPASSAQAPTTDP